MTPAENTGLKAPKYAIVFQLGLPESKYTVFPLLKMYEKNVIDVIHPQVVSDVVI